jgi:EAL domain-containing protein (putative c-di-GMP-specific phosphodiesterase class I)
MEGPVKCEGCADGVEPPFPFTMAFQPIVDVAAGSVWAYEALVRGPEGQSAAHVLGQVVPQNQYRFDQACRVKAIELAGALFPADGDVRVSINFMPNAVYEPAACIRTSLAAASRVGFPPERIVFEFTESEQVADPAHVRRIVETYREIGFVTALDDFGSGHSGLRLLADLNPGVIKIDMDLVRGLDADARRRAIVAGVARIARDLGTTVVAEGVETAAEVAALRDVGITLLQGYFFARPAVEALPAVAWEGPAGHLTPAR